MWYLEYIFSYPVLVALFLGYLGLRYQLIKRSKTLNQKEGLSLSDRMKSYEKESECVTKILPYQDFNLRLDGKNFSRQTKGLNKPFDELFTIAMRNTAVDLFTEYQPSSVFVQSDEITLTFPAKYSKDKPDTKENTSEHIFGGRVPKILSNCSGFASTRFTCHMFNLLRESTQESKESKSQIVETHRKYLTKIYPNDKLTATYNFDSRVTIFPEGKQHEIVNNVYWRAIFDGYRNFVSMLGYSVFSSKFLEDKTTNARVELLKEKGIDMDSYPAHYKYGWIIKRRQVPEKKVIKIKNKDDEEITVMRNKITAVSLPITYSSEMQDLILQKYLPDNSSLQYLERFDYQ